MHPDRLSMQSECYSDVNRLRSAVGSGKHHCRADPPSPIL